MKSEAAVYSRHKPDHYFSGVSRLPLPFCPRFRPHEMTWTMINISRPSSSMAANMVTLPPRISNLPLSASKIQHLTLGNTSLLAHRARQRTSQQSEVLFAPPKNIIKPWKSITGGQEWATSSYSYNKNMTKTMPTAQDVTDKLLRDYMTMVEDTGLGHSAKSSAARQATTARRRALEKTYVTSSTAKDYGDKIVVNAFVYDAAAGAQRAKEKQTADWAKLRQQNASSGMRRRGSGPGPGSAGELRRTGGFGAPRRAGLHGGIPSQAASRRSALTGESSATRPPRRFEPPGSGSSLGASQRLSLSKKSPDSAGRPQAGQAFWTFRPSGSVASSGVRPPLLPDV
nr:hypothetical protein CFP56_12936 [Quercus suber]